MDEIGSYTLEVKNLKISNNKIYKIAKNLNIERSAAQNYIESYFTQYPSVKKYMEDAKQVASVRFKYIFDIQFMPLGFRRWIMPTRTKFI